jgi:flagellar M-ring protein FliF
MNSLLKQIATVWSKLEIAQKVTIALVLIAFAALAVVIGYTSTRPDYKLLARDLTPAQTAEIAAYLDSAHVPYQVIDHETAVMVPSANLYKLRNDLAERQVLGDGSHGFELLDQSHLWDSTFSEHKNYDRAVQGELERSFREIPGVKSARVIIDRPAPSPFLGDEEGKPRASIKLDMKTGSRLTSRQITGVVHLTSGAITNLSPERVQVMDGGGLLTVSGQDTGAMAAQTSLDAEIARETYLTRKAQDLLDATLGPGRSQVKVAVKLDFTKRTESSSNPDLSKPLRESSTTTDERTPVVGSGGVAGTASNVEGENRTSLSETIATKTTEDVKTENFIGKKTITEEDEVGRIKGMTVSILLDYNTVTVPKLDEKGQPTKESTTERKEFTEAEKKRFEALVLAAIGFDAAKGIQLVKEPANVVGQRFTVTTQSIALWQPPSEEVVVASVNPLGSTALKDYIGYGVAGLFAIIVLVVARGQLKRSHRAWQEAEERAREDEAAGRTREPREDEELAQRRRADMKETIKRKIQENPASAAVIIRKWINE